MGASCVAPATLAAINDAISSKCATEEKLLPYYQGLTDQVKYYLGSHMYLFMTLKSEQFSPVKTRSYHH